MAYPVTAEKEIYSIDSLSEGPHLISKTGFHDNGINVYVITDTTYINVDGILCNGMCHV